MASQRKIRVQKQRKSRKEKKKEEFRQKLREQAEQKRESSKRRREIKEQLGFSELLKRIQIPKPEPRQPILDWNGVKW